MISFAWPDIDDFGTALCDAAAIAVERLFSSGGGTATLFWVYLLACVPLAAISFKLHANRGRPFRLREFVAFAIPPRLYLHRSALVDYQIYLLGKVLQPAHLLIGSFTIAWVASKVSAGLDASLGPTRLPSEIGFGRLLGFTLAMAVIWDLSHFVTHVLRHRVRFLWELHKLHHSAEVLTPMTSYRVHPLGLAFHMLIQSAVLGSCQGVFIHAMIGEASVLTLFGGNVILSACHLIGSNLHHTHIWLSFGPMLNHILISPAQHQIHHSSQPRHTHSNFGTFFALWDWMFGTLQLPGERQQLSFGLPGGETGIHRNLWLAYTDPVVRSLGALLRPARRS